MDKLREYIILVRSFLSGAITFESFQRLFFDKFQSEDDPLGDKLYEPLNEIFGALDSCTDDDDLLSEKEGYYISRDQMLKEVRAAYVRLSCLDME